MIDEHDEDRFVGAADASPESPRDAEIARLNEALAARSRELEAAQDRILRLTAEFDNARKRTAREREELVRSASEALLRDLLPVLDNFDRALGAARSDPGAAAVTAGVELIQRELLRVLEKAGATPFSSAGAPFDPERHEAVARVPAQGQPEMTVVNEIARGWTLNGRVLRPAMVTVAVGADPSE